MAVNLIRFQAVQQPARTKSAANLRRARLALFCGLAGPRNGENLDSPRDATLENMMKPASTLRAYAFALAILPLSAAFSGAVARPTVEVAFVLDTTGSMGGLIEGAKRKIWSIATAIVDSNPDADIRMGLVAYRDIVDEYVTKKFELTTDIQALYANLLELKARGGGDWPESVNEALDVAINKLQWTQGGDTRRIVFLCGEAPRNMDYAQA